MRYLTLSLALFATLSSAHYFTGSCPTIQPMANFNLTQLDGKWYMAVADTSRIPPCVGFDFKAVDDQTTKVSERTYDPV